MFFLSMVMPGKEMGFEPVAMRMRLVSRDCVTLPSSSRSSTLDVEAMRPQQLLNASILFFLKFIYIGPYYLSFCGITVKNCQELCGHERVNSIFSHAVKKSKEQSP